MTALIRKTLLPGLLLLGLLGIGPAWAHPGHDETPVAPATASAPRAEAHSDDLELVAAVSARRTAIIYLDRFATNEPVEGATIEVSDNGTPGIIATALPEGGYKLVAPWIDQPGKHDLTFTVTAGELTDLLAATVEIPAAPEAAATGSAGKGQLQQAIATQKAVLLPALTFVLGIVVAMVFRFQGRSRAIAGGFAMLTFLLLGGVAYAHGGVDDGDEAPAAIIASDAPKRLSDGSVFVPKPAQRLLAVRTAVANETEAARVTQIIGQVTSDPNTAGRVQPSQSGRIEPGDRGLAFIGQRVEKGDVLAAIAPAFGAIERGTVGSQVADIDQQIRVAEQKVARLSGLAGSVPGKEIDEARAELEGARKRRLAVAPTLGQRELLRAPVSGVVSVANAVAGQLVESKDILFEIVDPTRLWVEATAFEPRLAEQMKGGAAVTADGTELKLAFVGRGLALRQGAIPLMFRIEQPPPSLNVGTPVTVIVAVSGTRRGIALPRAALVRLANGGLAVWDHVTAERFVSRPVRIEPLDGATVLVLAGITPQQRIVVSGADLLSQVR